MSIKILACGSALALSAALALPSAATAQVSGTQIAIANPTDSIFSSKAWAAANNQILTTYKTQIDQRKAVEVQLQAQLALLDKNGDKQVDDAELNAAVAANSPAVTTVNTLNQQIQQLVQPLLMAQAFVLDTISNRYEISLQKIITDRKITAVFAPDALVFPLAGPINITQAVTAEVDRILPTTSVTPPPNWQLTPQAQSLMQQWQQIQEINQQRQAAAAAAAPVAAPATGRAPATPAAPARGSTQQPAAR